MRKITLVGVIVVLVAAVVGVFTALQFGEKSPIYASGSVRLPSELAADAAGIETMYVVVYNPDSPMPMPYGAMRLRLPEPVMASGTQFFDFFITKERLQVMNENDQMRPPPARLRLKVRLDRDGVAGPDRPGDLTGNLPLIELGSTGIEITIDQVIPES